MKRRYAYKKDDNYKQVRLDNEHLNGYVCFLKLQNVTKPIFVNNGKEEICIIDNGYELIEVYPDNAKYALTIMFDDKDNLIEWYFDISRGVGIEDGIPYEDDLFLDMVITPDGERIVIDEDELLDARDNNLITQNDVDDAYSTLKYLDEKYCNRLPELIDFTKYLIGLFKNDIRLAPYTDNERKKI